MYYAIREFNGLTIVEILTSEGFIFSCDISPVDEIQQSLSVLRTSADFTEVSAERLRELSDIRRK